MPQQYYGISSITQNSNPGIKLTSDGEGEVISVRVLDIILDDSHPLFEEYGEWNSIGTIFYDDIAVPTGVDSLNFARPLFANQKLYPLINELVPLLFLTSPSSQLNTSRKTAYYLPTINLWNSQHHNALPDPTSDIGQATLDDYEQAERGVVRRVQDQSTEIDLGEGFEEKINIHPLQPYIGDNVFEGRWGNSIRLGSTVKNKNNEWSSTGENGDPIIIIRNGQRDNIDVDGWVPIAEEINEDKSSLYLASGQKLPLEIANATFDSQPSPPTNPKEYTGNQIILNSGRLVLNAKNDNVIISANDAVSITSPDVVGIDANKFIVAGERIYLGNKTEGQLQPILRGDDTVEVLVETFTELAKWFECVELLGDPKLEAIIGPAKQMSDLITEDIVPNLKNKCRSKQNFTQ